MSEFSDQLSVLVSRFLKGADADTKGEIIERLLYSTALAIAVASKGDKETMENMLVAAEAHLSREAIALAPLGEAIG